MRDSTKVRLIIIKLIEVRISSISNRRISTLNNKNSTGVRIRVIKKQGKKNMLLLLLLDIRV